MTISKQLKDQAKLLYSRGLGTKAIGDQLDISYKTVYRWIHVGTVGEAAWKTTVKMTGEDSLVNTIQNLDARLASHADSLAASMDGSAESIKIAAELGILLLNFKAKYMDLEDRVETREKQKGEKELLPSNELDVQRVEDQLRNSGLFGT